MDDTLAGFELDCRQARRGFKVSMAVKVFGVGSLLPNNLAGGESDFSRLKTPDTGIGDFMPRGKLATDQAGAKKGN